MKRSLLFLAPLALLAGCVVRAGPYEPGYVEPAPAYPPPQAYEPPPPPPQAYEPPPQAYAPPPSYAPPPAPRLRVQYFGQHYIPEDQGGGWCYQDGPHVHDYLPDRSDWFENDGGYLYYRGPFEFAFVGGHPLPGGGWCPVQGLHFHDYYPPRGNDWYWQRDRGYVYRGQYRAERPPPPRYWPRPLPPPPRVAPPPPRPPGRMLDRPILRELYRPTHPAPGAPVRPLPAPPRPPPERLDGPRQGWDRAEPPRPLPAPPRPAAEPPGRPDPRFEDRRDDRARGHDDGRPGPVPAVAPPVRAGTPPGHLAPPPGRGPPRENPVVRPEPQRAPVAQPQGGDPSKKDRSDEKKDDKRDDKKDDRRPRPPGR